MTNIKELEARVAVLEETVKYLDDFAEALETDQSYLLESFIVFLKASTTKDMQVTKTLEILTEASMGVDKDDRKTEVLQTKRRTIN